MSTNLSQNVKKAIAAVGIAAVIAVGGVVAAGSAMAQSPTPTAPSTTAPSTTAPSGAPVWDGGGPGMGLFGGSFKEFDAAAKALNLTPVQLFEQLDGGKTLQEVATAQGVDLTTVQTAVNALRVQSQKDAINQAVKDGQITQAQADWLLQGLANGYMPMGRGGRGHGGGLGIGQAPAQAPSQQTPSSTVTPGA